MDKLNIWENINIYNNKFASSGKLNLMTRQEGPFGANS